MLALPEAVLAAFVDELIEHGYSQLTFEALAVRSGVHKTTLYRRWGSRHALLLDAARDLAEHAVLVPDTGRFESDLRELASQVAATLTAPTGQALLRAVVAEAMVNTEVADTLRRFWHERYTLTGAIVERAVERGDIPFGTPVRPILELLIGPLYLRALITLDPIDDDFLADHVTRVARLAGGDNDDIDA